MYDMADMLIVIAIVAVITWGLTTMIYTTKHEK